MSCWFESIILQKCLGSGSFGLVFQAISKHTLEISAVKIIFLEDSEDECNEEESRILREYELLQGKTHPNIVSALNLIQKEFHLVELRELFGKIANSSGAKKVRKSHFIGQACELGHIRAFCLKMELCGETLREWVNHYAEKVEPKERERLVWDKGFLQVQFEISQGLLNGIKFLHGHKIIHRDFKPENVMFSGSGFTLPVRIGDFGLCRQIHSELSCTGVLTSNQGTMAYRAPEMNSNDYGEPVDLYALGLVLLEVLQLVKHSDRHTLFDRIVNDNETELIQNHHLIPNARDVMIRLTKKKLDQRFSSAEEVTLSMISSSSFLNIFTATDLVNCFMHCQDGDHILLHSGVYIGPFHLSRKNNILIKGIAPGHVILRAASSSLISGSDSAAVLQITGNFCTVRNLSLTSTQVKPALVVQGDSNLVKNVEVPLCKNGIRLVGNCNTVSNAIITSATYNGVSLRGNGNIVEGLNCTSGFSGVLIHGKENRLRNIVVSAANLATNMEMGYSGVRHGFGSRNEIDGLICKISKRPFKEWGFSCFSATASLATIRNVECHYIFLNGSCHRMENVDCKLVLRIYGSLHDLRHVAGDRCEIHGDEIHKKDVHLTKCKFKTVVYNRKERSRGRRNCTVL